jgi:ligand-binding SRPBCC domain-containing protein
VEVTFQQVLDVAREDLFAFHTDPQNLAVLLEGWPGFRLRSHSGHIRAGAQTALIQSVGPFRFRLTFEHFLLEPPSCFGERMVVGPFVRFEHVHEFREDGGRTAIVDRLSYELPWRWGGRLAERWIVSPTLRKFFAFRENAYRRLIAAGQIPVR